MGKVIQVWEEQKTWKPLCNLKNAPDLIEEYIHRNLLLPCPSWLSGVQVWRQESVVTHAQWKYRKGIGSWGRMAEGMGSHVMGYKKWVWVRLDNFDTQSKNVSSECCRAHNSILCDLDHSLGNTFYLQYHQSGQSQHLSYSWFFGFFLFWLDTSSLFAGWKIYSFLTTTGLYSTWPLELPKCAAKWCHRHKGMASNKVKIK